MVEATTENNSSGGGDEQPKIVIFVLGTTGVGKSKLAMDLASRQTHDIGGAKGEIINADSMQIYGGNLDGAMTARPTPGDHERVPHHLYAFLDMLDFPDSETFNVQKYRHLALAQIAEVHGRGNVPIVCGGTNYYIEALLFNEDEEAAQVGFDTPAFTTAFDAYRLRKEELREEKFADLLTSFRRNIPLDNKQEIEDTFESHLCHDLLAVADPAMAGYLHTNDKRKIVNALFKSFKQLPSDSPVAQSEITSGVTGLRLRFRPILVWVKADKEVLEERIRKRVDKMIDQENGLAEIFHVFDAFSDKPELDFSKGILQSIGYKEFYDYYRDQRQGGGDQVTLASAKERLCSKTLQYAQYQMKWLKKRILPIFKPGLETKPDLLHQIVLNDPREYEEVAVQQATTFITEMLSHYNSTAFSAETYASHFLEVKASKFANWRKYVCELCGDMELNGQLEWGKHLKTRKHYNRKRQAAKGHDSDRQFYIDRKKRLEEEAALHREQNPTTSPQAQTVMDNQAGPSEEGAIDDIAAIFN